MSESLEAFRRALGRLEEVLSLEPSDVVRDAAIQRFEFTFELAWKAIQSAARFEGLDCRSPRSCLKLAFQQEWIVDEATWLSVLTDRDRTSHTYDENLAKTIFEHLPRYTPLFEKLLVSLDAIGD